MQVKNIIFDFGGVFIDVDYKRTEKAFIDAGIDNFNELYSQQSASPLFEDLETGKLQNDHFYNEFRKVSGVELTNDQITTCWNSILGNYWPEAIDQAKNLKKNYRLFLFSNTNAIHYDCFMNIYRQQFGKDDFNDLFEKAYYSHTSGIRKPYVEAYEWVLKDAGISAADTLFIDDTYPNIKGAEKAGLQTIHLKPPMRLWELDLK
jgi:putative hydrolase of the HAD superfamily